MRRIFSQRGDYFLGSGGIQLFFRSYPVNNARAIFIVVHGLGEHSGRYWDFVDFFGQKNFALYFFDLRGHGLSAGRRGHIANFNEYILDLKEFYTLVKNRENTGNIFLVGHSLGGLIVLRYIQEFPHNIKGVILSSPALKSLIPISRFKLYWLNLLSNILPEAAFFNQINPDFLSHQPQIVEDYKKDKLVHKCISARSFTEISKAMGEVYKKIELIKVPCLLLQAGSDKIVSAALANSFFKRLKVKDKQLKVYPEMYHELFNETANKIVFEDISNWVSPLI